MYFVAVRRDFHDQAAVDEFARQVRDREGLSNLYLLTIADISTTSPTSMTAWKARMLDELFVAVDARLEGASDAGRGARVRVEVEACWDPSCDRDFLDEYLKSMPESGRDCSARARGLPRSQLASERGTRSLEPSGNGRALRGDR